MANPQVTSDATTPAAGSDRVRFYVDLYMIVLAVVSVAFVVWHEVRPLSPDAFQVVAAVDLAIVFIFAGEWVWGFRRAEDRRQYVKETWLELPGLIPFYVEAYGVLKGLRLLRLLRLLRVMRAVRHYRDVPRLNAADLLSALKTSRLGYTAAITVSIIVTGSTLVWFFESAAATPRITSWYEALWWGVVTVTTVGYGDITPVTPGGRAVAALLMLVGVGLIGVLASTISAALILQREGGASPGVPGIPTGTGNILVEELERLAALKDRGLINDEEFERAKKRLLR